MFSTLLWASCDCECYRKIVTVLLMHWKRLAFEVLWCMQSKMNIHRTYINKKNQLILILDNIGFPLIAFCSFHAVLNDAVIVFLCIQVTTNRKVNIDIFFWYLYIKFLAHSETQQLSRGNGLNRLYFINNMKIVQ